ncbi:MAG: cell division protein FtsA [Candidatus Kryptoniota bacterium]
MNKIIVALDIGTTKVCALVVESDRNGRLNVLGIGTSKSGGVSRGVVANIDRTVKSIQEAVGIAESKAGTKIKSAIVGIAGEHIESFKTNSIITISNMEHEITEDDIDRLIEDAKRVHLSRDRQIIHIIPQEFTIDGQTITHDPIGMAGVRVEGSMHIVTGLITAAQNIYKCVERAGLKVQDLVLQPLASSYSVLTEEEKEVGVALLDIGGGTTDLAVFEDRTIRHTAVIPIAGDHVTTDIRKGLGVLTDQAEELKVNHGYAMVSEIMDDEPITIPGIGGRRPVEINKRLLAQIIQPRVEELLEIVAMEIKRSGYSRHLSAGIVLTGGGALLRGMPDLVEHVLGVPAKIGIPQTFDGGFAREVENPIYATAVGLVLYGLHPGMGKSTITQEDIFAEIPRPTVKQETLFGDDAVISGQNNQKAKEPEKPQKSFLQSFIQSVRRFINRNIDNV